MGLSVSEVVSLAKRSHKLRVTLQDLVKKLAVVDMVSTFRGMTISRLLSDPDDGVRQAAEEARDQSNRND